MSSLNGLLALLRPRQWTKNAVCFAGVFFAGNIQWHSAMRACVAAAAFCAASSFVYIVNDIHDRDRDRLHPRKRLRAIASGKVTVAQALVFCAPVLCIAAALGLYLGPPVAAILGCYVVMNICYSAGLKNLSLVDATVVAAGFILRVYAGTLAVDVVPSAWLLLCTFFLALFLAFGKRRAEINAISRHASSVEAVAPIVEGEPPQGTYFPRIDATRALLHKYNVAMLDRFCNICATLTIATYSLFTVLGHANRSFIITTPPVVMGIFRYLLLVERYHEGEAPEAILLKDWAIQLAILIWMALYIAVLYGQLNIDVQ
jgi:4-hydroxybenzoate polyprenyltransferase